MTCGRCGGHLIEPKRRTCCMPAEERGWDYWAQCTACGRGFFGYEPEEATRRCASAEKSP